MIKAGTSLLAIACLTSVTLAEWPKRVFAPYMYIGSGDKFKITECADATGQKFFTLAFIIANDKGEPAWDGRIPLEKNIYAEEIAGIRTRGGDVIISFGGWGGTELAIAEEDPVKLQAKYQAVIDQYKFTWLDFDIENKGAKNVAANERRNAVLAKLQARNPGLIVSYTVPVDPDGMPKHSQQMLADAKAKGVKVHSANVMTMAFGERHSQGKKMTNVCIASAQKAYEQCQKIDPNLKIGLTPMIGVGDVKSEIFSVEDARALLAWAEKQPWVCSIAFWSVNRDNSDSTTKDKANTRSGVPQEKFEFTKLLKTFTTK